MKKIIGLLLSILLFMLCFACGNQPVNAGEQTTAEDVSEGGHTVIYGVEATDPVGIHTELQETFLRLPFRSVFKGASGQEELSRPEPLVLDWSDWAKSHPATAYMVTFHSEDGIDERSYTTTETTYAVSNLLINSVYTWYVCADGVQGEASTFRTADVIIRNLAIDGVANARDLGGYRTSDGKTVRQGMLFRCGRLNKSRAETVEIEVTEEGKQVMLEELHIRSEIDLRRIDNGEVGGISSCVLGDGVQYYSAPMEYAPAEFDGDALLANAEMLRYVFSILADESNYPLCFHCDIGTDRTGMIAFLVNGLCGVDETDLYYDYEFSNFGFIQTARRYKNLLDKPYMQHLQDADGNTLQEKVRSVLLEIGVPEADLNRVVEIMTAP